MDKVLVSTHWRRPEYTRQSLAALHRCRGIDEYEVYFHVDGGGNPEVPHLIKDYAASHPAVTVIEYDQRQGCNRNLHNALSCGFKHGDYVVVMEDDILFSSDALEYFQWAGRRYVNDSQVFTISAYRKGRPAPDDYHAVRKDPTFCPWGWATWRDRWEQMDRQWADNGPVSWDIKVNHTMRGERVEIRPLLARAQNIGAELGAHCPGPEFHRQYQFNAFGAWSVDLGPSTFHEVKAASRVIND